MGHRLTSGPPAEAGPAILPAPAPSPRPSPPRALSSFSPRARVRVRPRQARRAAWRAHAGDAGWVVSRGPSKQARLAVFKPQQLRFSQHSSFSSPALRPYFAPHRALLAPPSPPQLRRRNWPPVVHHCPQSSTCRSASLPDTWCSLQGHHLSKV